MSDKATDPSTDSQGSISWKLIREALARREFSGMDIAEVKQVSGESDGTMTVSGRDSAGAIVKRTVKADPALQRIAATAAQTSEQIQALYGLAKKQSAVWFASSAVAAVLGFVLVLGGIVAMWFYQLDVVAVFSTVCGVLLEMVARLFFQQSREANTRIDKYREDLLEAQAIFHAIELVGASESSEDEDRLREMIVRRLLGLDQSS